MEDIELNNININKNFHLIWKNLNMKIKEKKIINDFSGYVVSNKLTIIMGPSGSGKTTFLNILAGRVNKSRDTELSGFIYLNHTLRNFSNFKKLCVYLTQEDQLYPFLTVYETIELATYFYLNKDISNRGEIIKDTINILGLNTSQNSIIKTLSGGEKKRVSIGIEMITDPKIILLDEPTSGIDSFQALIIVELLHKLSRKDRIVISSLHQPSSSLIPMFDNLILLTNGTIVYSGDFKEAINYFENIGLINILNFNTVDYLLDIVSLDYRHRDNLIERRKTIDNLINEWKYYKHNIDLSQIPTDVIIYRETDYTPNILNLFIRAFKQNYRNKLAIKIKVFTNIFIAIVLGIIYSKKANSTNEIQDKLGILFYITINQAFSGAISILNVFPNEKKIVMKELDSNAYKLSYYYITKVLAELPFTLISPIIFGIINYWTVGLNQHFLNFYLFICILIIESITAMGLGLIVSSFSPTVEIASSIAPSILIIFFLFAGLFININDLPKGIKWFSNVSFMKWAFEGLVINEFKDRKYKCDISDIICIENGNDIIKMYSFENGNVYQSLGIMSILCSTFCILGGLILWINRNKYIIL